MAVAALPKVACSAVSPELPVPDVPAAVAYYASKLGFAPAFTWGDPPTFAGVNLGKTQVFLKQGTPNASSAYFLVEDVDALLAFHVANAVDVVQPVADRDYGIRDYTVRDAFGHHLTFGQAIFTAGEPIVVDRVDVTVRLEKRLAALLADVAALKRMTAGQVLEEMITHTNDGVGPHTETQIEQIRALKAKHGIDYDTHASYRFVERSGT